MGRRTITSHKYPPGCQIGWCSLKKAITNGTTTRPLLLQLEDIYIGAEIDSSYLHVTVADDLALIAEDKSYAQAMVWDADISAVRERYCIHPTKSHTLWYNQRKKKDTELDIFMAGEKVDNPNSIVHLGIVGNTSGKAAIEGNITLGRKTAYSLMDAGLHGVVG